MRSVRKTGRLKSASRFRDTLLGLFIFLFFHVFGLTGERPNRVKFEYLAGYLVSGARLGWKSVISIGGLVSDLVVS